MTYSNNFVAVVKHKGRILRERDGMVTLPFGSEYSILLKNLEARQAVVKVSVDGEDVLDGNSIIIGANSRMTLKGFMKGACVKNRFKFIQKTKEIIDHRGDRVDDGMIRVEFKFEKKSVTEVVKRDYWYDPIPWRPYTPPCPPVRYRWIQPDGSTAGGCGCYNMSNNVSCDSSSSMKVKLFNSVPLKDEGITVKGSEIRQDFVYGYINDLEEQASVIVIRLRGVKSNGKTVVEKPLVVREKTTCSTCGRKNRSTNKFCYNCGTCLE